MNAQATGLAAVWTIRRIMSGMMFERGDLLLVPFPFTDLSAVKRRPVLAVTTADSYGDFIAIPVTSRPQAEHGLPLASNGFADWNAAGSELDTHQSYRHAQCQSGGQERRTHFRENRGICGRALLRVHWISRTKVTASPRRER